MLPGRKVQGTREWREMDSNTFVRAVLDQNQGIKTVEELRAAADALRTSRGNLAFQFTKFTLTTVEPPVDHSALFVRHITRALGGPVLPDGTIVRAHRSAPPEAEL